MLPIELFWCLGVAISGSVITAILQEVRFPRLVISVQVVRA
jgi:hypothetical protein